MDCGMRPEFVVDLVTRLDFPRVVGTDGEERGFGVVKQALAVFGVDAWFEEFSSPWLEFAEADFSLEGECFPIRPLVNPVFDGPWTPVARDADVEGPLTEPTDMPHPAEGSVAVRTELDRKNPCTAGASAQLFACQPEQGFVAYYLAAVGGLGRPMPSAYIDPHLEKFLVANLGRTCRFRWVSRDCTKTLRNLVAEIRGSQRPDEVICVGAHMDSFPGTVGANDNASGCARLVEFARWFKEHPPLRSMRFIWFTAEELDRRGSQAYVQARAGDADKIVLYVNVDGGVSVDHEWPHLGEAHREQINAITEESLASVCVPEGRGIFTQPEELDSTSDAAAFQDAGIPAIFLPGGGKRKTPGAHPHLPTDTVDKLDVANIQASLLLGTAFLDRIQQHRIAAADVQGPPT